MGAKKPFDANAKAQKTYTFQLTKNLPVPLHLSVQDRPAWQEQQGQKLLRDIQKFATDNNRTNELAFAQVIPGSQQVHLECSRALACDISEAVGGRLMPGAAAPPCKHGTHPAPIICWPKR